MSAGASHPIDGRVGPGFEAVREAFADNFVRRRELGGACCAYHRGEKVVDLWGGVRNEQTGDPWEQDTMVIVYSATKGLAAMTPGTRLAYHGITLGFYEGELLGRIDSRHRSLGQFFQDEIASPHQAARGDPQLAAGGALGFADPAAGVGYAYVTNRMGTRLSGDPRDVALRDALYSGLPARQASGQLTS